MKKFLNKKVYDFTWGQYLKFMVVIYGCCALFAYDIPKKCINFVKGLFKKEDVEV